MTKTIFRKSKALFLAVSLAGALWVSISWTVPAQAALGLSFKVEPLSYIPRTTAIEIAGTPKIENTVRVLAQYAAAPGDGTVVTLTVGSQCLAGTYSKGGFDAPGSTTVTDSLSQHNTSSTFYVWGADDSKYEGTHACTVTVNTASPNAEANGVTASFSLKIEDNDPAPAATPKPTATTPRTTTATPAPAEPAAPPAIATDTIKLNDQTSTTDGQQLTFEEKEPVTLSGKTIPNGKVKLYIFSEPRTAEVVADAQGNWTYAIENLEPGDHRVEAEVTDPATNKTSPKAELAKFTVQEKADTPASTTTAPKPRSKLPFIIGGVAGVLAIGAGGFFGLRWWKQRKATPSVNPTHTDTVIEPIHPSQTKDSDNTNKQ